jgi:hypothetical protein
VDMSADFAGNATDGDWIEAHVDIASAGKE